MEQLLKQIETIKAAVIIKENKNDFDNGVLCGLDCIITMIKDKIEKQ